MKSFEYGGQYNSRPLPPAGLQQIFRSFQIFEINLAHLNFENFS